MADTPIKVRPEFRTMSSASPNTLIIGVVSIALLMCCLLFIVLAILR
jgi:hypothetical protein